VGAGNRFQVARHRAVISTENNRATAAQATSSRSRQ
jgi:hypothetical protein